MRRTFVLCLSLSALLLTGCAGIVLSPEARQSLPLKQHLDVPFFAQQAYHCGPAALASALQYRTVPVSPEQLAERVYVPEKKGSLALEMQAAARQFGMLAYPLAPGVEALLYELAAGNPVLVLQNLGFDWWPQWHYALAVGFEERGQLLLLHSGSRADYRLPLHTFAATWARADYWARVILPPEQTPATAEVLPYLAAAGDLEATGQRTAALVAYRSALRRWPQRAEVQFAAGTAAYGQGQLQQAYRFYRRSVELQPDFAAAWNNLAYVLKDLGCTAAAQRAVQRAQELAPGDARFRDSAAELAAESAAAANCALGDGVSLP